MTVGVGQWIGSVICEICGYISLGIRAKAVCLRQDLEAIL